MKKLFLFLIPLFMISCNETQTSQTTPTIDEFDYKVDQFADIQILRYRVPDFEKLTLQQKELIYYLSEAALQGRDIIYDQNNKYNLVIRKTLEALYENLADKSSDNYKQLEIYLKRIWLANGIHHHYSTDKMIPAFDQSYFAESVNSIDASLLPLREGETVEELIELLTPILFDPNVMPKRVNQADGVDLISTSANNYYEGVSQKEVEEFYDKMRDPNDLTPISYGLNSKLMKVNGEVVEVVYREGGMYGEAITKILYWLDKAMAVAENDKQKAYIGTLIEFYKTGDLKTYDKYSIEWAQELEAQIDFLNAFTETYGDPLGMKASWESLVNYKNMEATKRTEIISNNAQWFEDNSPTDPQFKKEEVTGVSAKVITAAIIGGDNFPATPIGINLPNSNWIRSQYGSKSVTIENFTEAYAQAAESSGFNEEFVWSDVERDLLHQYGNLTNNLDIDLHECLGHGSGKLLPGITKDALRSHASTIEETRADLFALYYLGDEKMVELGLLPNMEAHKAEYYKFMMNGLMTQLTRIELGKDVEEAHMRNRQLIAQWVYQNGEADNVVEIKIKDGKRYLVINDYKKLRQLFGQLLTEIQRITSTGDYEAARIIVEKYAVKVDQDLHKEILERYATLGIAPYSGFVNPVYTLVTDKNGKVKDVTLSYEENYVNQHLRYSKTYSNLPTYN